MLQRKLTPNAKFEWYLQSLDDRIRVFVRLGLAAEVTCYGLHT
jgi:hypothetical protein